MIRILLKGCNGKMGRMISESVSKADNVEICCGCDFFGENSAYPVFKKLSEVDIPADVMIDFSSPSSFGDVVDYCRAKSMPIVMATTGLSAEQKNELYALSEDVPVFCSANMSLGISLIMQLAVKTAKTLYPSFNIEIVEKHHNQKVDAPSGTALMIADAMNEAISPSAEYVYDRHEKRQKRAENEIGIHAIRGGTIVGEHEIIFAGHDEIVEIKHSALSRQVFAEGAIKAAIYLASKKGGHGFYNMESMLTEIESDI